jgi:TP901-1 family phage major tail protein
MSLKYMEKIVPQDILVKVDDRTRGFTTVAGLRIRRVGINGETVEPNRWAAFFDGKPIKRASVSGRGLFRDAASDELMRAQFFDGTVKDYQFVFPNIGTVSGPFQITSLEFAGEHNGEVTFDLALEAAGDCQFDKAA